MKKYIDMGIEFVRKHTYFNFIEIGESWIEKIGVWGLYFVFAAMIFLICMVNWKTIDYAFGNPLLVFLMAALASFFVGYVADKTLEYVKPTIKSAQTRLVNGAILDLLAIIVALGSVVAFFSLFYISIRAGLIMPFLSGLLILVGGAYLTAILLNPEKSLNVKISDSATPAQSFIALLSVFVKLFYRLVPVAFGVLMIIAVLQGFDLLFAKYVSEYTIEGFVSSLSIGALLPLIGYFLFLLYYFFIDYIASILHMASDVKKIAESKESHKSK